MEKSFKKFTKTLPLPSNFDTTSKNSQYKTKKWLWMFKSMDY